MTAANASINGMSLLIPRTFNNSQITQRKADGYLNATAMCKTSDKLFANYKQNKTTDEYLHALSIDVGIPISELIQSSRGRLPSNQIGTWVHPKVAIHLAQWLSPEFAVQVSSWILEWMEGGNGHQTHALTSTENTPDVQHWITTQSPGQPPVTRQIDISVLLELSNDFPDFCMVPTQQLEALTSLLGKVSSKGMDLLQFGTSTNVSH